MASGSAVHRQSKEADRTACNRGATAHRSDSRRTRRHLTPEWSVPSVRRARGRRSPPPPLTPLSAPEKIGRRRRKWGFRTAKLGFDPGGENVSHPMASNGRRCSGLGGPDPGLSSAGRILAPEKRGPRELLKGRFNWAQYGFRTKIKVRACQFIS
jgi:hypothetical protein